MTDVFYSVIADLQSQDGARRVFAEAGLGVDLYVLTTTYIGKHSPVYLEKASLLTRLKIDQ